MTVPCCQDSLKYQLTHSEPQHRYVSSYRINLISKVSSHKDTGLGRGRCQMSSIHRPMSLTILDHKRGGDDIVGDCVDPKALELPSDYRRLGLGSKLD